MSQSSVEQNYLISAILTVGWCNTAVDCKLQRPWEGGWHSTSSKGQPWPTE